jgi:hypothetical protein
MQMIAEFPFLDDYENLWPLEHLLIGKLKYSSAAAKGSASHKIITDVRDTIALNANHSGRRR